MFLGSSVGSLAAGPARSSNSMFNLHFNSILNHNRWRTLLEPRSGHFSVEKYKDDERCWKDELNSTDIHHHIELPFGKQA